MLPSLPKNVERRLKREIDNFFAHAVGIYLDELTQKSLRNPFKQDSIVCINHFIDAVKSADFSHRKLEGELACINRWKRDFTKKVLIPKYLLHRYNPPLEALTEWIKQAILGAAIQRKTTFYIQICKSNLIKTLQTISPSKRMPKAKQLLYFSMQELAKNDRDFSKELFMQAFDFEHLKTLLLHIPQRSEPKLSYADEHFLDQAEEKLMTHILSCLTLDQQKAPKLTEQLLLVHQFLIQLQKDKHALASWGFPEKEEFPSLKKRLYQAILKCKAKVFLHFYLREVQDAKKQVSFELFAKSREAILKKYLSLYIHNHPDLKNVREYFLHELKEIEKKERYLPFEALNLKKQELPKKRNYFKAWKRI